jgi:hypothetical protein
LLRKVITGQVARAAHLEQLEGLRFDALGRVEHHHHGVDGCQHAVGVLAEVAVTRRVEQVEHVIAVRELQRGGRDRDPRFCSISIQSLVAARRPVRALTAPASPSAPA